mgnify:CR=1 FL=1
MKSVYAGETFDFSHRGREFRAVVEYDDSQEAPWNSCGMVNVERAPSGYGRSWGQAKKPGELVFHRGDQHEYSYVCNIPDALKQARAEQWGLSPESTENLVSRLGRAPTKREIAVEAVRQNIEFLRGWCANDWTYVVIGVTLLDADGEPTGTMEYLGGVESCGDCARTEVAPGLADEILANRGQAWREALEEARARKYWACRDVVTA